MLSKWDLFLNTHFLSSSSAFRIIQNISDFIFIKKSLNQVSMLDLKKSSSKNFKYLIDVTEIEKPLGFANFSWFGPKSTKKDGKL